MFKWSDSDKIAIPVMLASIIILSLGLYFLTKNKSEKVRRIPLKIICLALVVLEIVKQFYFILKGTYTANHIPAHFCSLIVVIIILAEFLPKRFSKWFDVPSVVFPIIAITLVLVHPHSMIGSSSGKIFLNFPNFHAFMFHSLVISYPIIKLTIVRFDLKLKYCFSLIGCILFYACYAVPIAFKFQNNYINILWSMFTPLENFRIQFGQILYDILLFIIGVGASIAIYLIWYYIDRKVKIRRNKDDT